MRLTRQLGIGIAAVLTGWAAPCPASAEMKLTAFNGMWSGSGFDSNPPSHPSQQPTKCTTEVTAKEVTANLSIMTSDTDCDGQAGRKKIHLQIKLDRDQISGDLSQTTNGGDPEDGKVSGRRTGNTAKFKVEISVLKYATVDLKLLGPSSYSMHVVGTILGVFSGTVMHVVFHR